MTASLVPVRGLATTTCDVFGRSENTSTVDNEAVRSLVHAFVTSRLDYCNRRNGPAVKSVESVLRLEKSLWWERFVKEVGLEPGVKERGSYGW